MASGEVQPILDALKTVAVALKEESIPFALAGGYAVYARGGADSRHDADIVIREEDAHRARTTLRGRDLEVVDPPEDWLFKVRHGGEQVDVIYHLAAGPVDAALLDRANEIRVDSVCMPVLSATDLLISKLLPMTEHYCDFSPVLSLIRSLREQVDAERVDRACAGNPFARAALGLARDLSLLPPKEEDHDRRVPAEGR
ncbi:nucleotidyltransferase family protein [Ornithinimicrobium cavernae]|uniref:nucleotidyltransferase family protein n=1 Tax=Ornithinimicrobium cavernae TaxID=2666047 RepID=UPI000D686070|nr:nucleotidyltransferase family protein [Ornithinimicrobium cavernae]